MQELWFLRSTRRLMLIDMYMKFHEDRLNSFQVIERTRFCDRVQGSINARVNILVLCTSVVYPILLISSNVD